MQAYHRKYHQKNVVLLVNFSFSKDWWKNIEYKSGTKNCSSNDIEVILKGSIGLLLDGYILLENNDTITASGMVCVYNYSYTVICFIFAYKNFRQALEWRKLIIIMKIVYTVVVYTQWSCKNEIFAIWKFRNWNFCWWKLSKLRYMCYSSMGCSITQLIPF